MDIQQIVAQLKQELSRIDTAIAALDGSRRGRGRASKASPSVNRPGPRRMSAAARAKIAAAQRARWAKQKGTGAKNAKATKKQSSARKGMSAAARKKLSAMMKARWAARKKAA